MPVCSVRNIRTTMSLFLHIRAKNTLKKKKKKN